MSDCGPDLEKVIGNTPAMAFPTSGRTFPFYIRMNLSRANVRVRVIVTINFPIERGNSNRITFTLSMKLETCRFPMKTVPRCSLVLCRPENVSTPPCALNPLPHIFNSNEIK